MTWRATYGRPYVEVEFDEATCQSKTFPIKADETVSDFAYPVGWCKLQPVLNPCSGVGGFSVWNPNAINCFQVLLLGWCKLKQVLKAPGFSA